MKFKWISKNIQGVKIDINGKEKEIIFFTNHIRQCIEALFLGPVTFFDALKGQNPTHACPEQSVEFW